MANKKWFDVTEDQEQAVIRKKRKEWFPDAEEKDWEILKKLYSSIDLKKRNFRPLLKDIIHLFDPQNPREIKNFCTKFHQRILFFPEDMQCVQINDIGYRILIDETFRDIKETKFWLPYLEKILINNQVDDRTTKTDFREDELIERLQNFMSLVLLEDQRKTSEIIVRGIRRPNIKSLVISGIAYYYQGANSESIIGLQMAQILSKNPQE